ncbi:MAG: hypothetical protein II193_10335 [Lachnospiraceae bacterium]|nr:hypothetical protein [Lachnospiraceae bacterium]MBQ7065363.1 hypothetical protein [Lachnospiraceae bacterium]
MSYKKAEEILPLEIIQLIQQYVDGETIYIPRKDNERQEWGKNTETRRELAKRNEQIFKDFKNGERISRLADKYFLSEKSIQRIVYKMKKAS